MSDNTTTPTNRPANSHSPPTAVKAGRRPPRRSRKKKRGRTYTPEERRQAVEAYYHSGLPQAEFARVWGVSYSSLHTWIKRYEEGGPMALERGIHAGKGKRRIGRDVEQAIVETRKRFPAAGLLRIKNWLYRFRGVKVSTGSIRRTLVETNQPPRQAEQRKKKRRRPDVRRFERARPGALWQSDITSCVLPRSGLRCYLTVFLDDHSRFIVSWALALHQRQGLVIEALLTGIERFGKPEEVLTDQGRQYYSWRGKGGVQKLLIKQGIHHVVARSHHPQTLGKCERLWKTLGEEFWSRTSPRSLGEARERLGHFLTHFNHYRPHQGIGGLVPADRRASQAAAEREGAGGGVGGRAAGPCAEEASEAGGGAGEPETAGGSAAGDAGAAAGQDLEGGLRRWTEEADSKAGYPQSCDEASAGCSMLDAPQGKSG